MGATGLGSWVNSGSADMVRSTMMPCDGTASVRTNFYLDYYYYYYEFYDDNTFRSPLLGESNEGVVTFSLNYKVVDYLGGGIPANYFKIALQWANSTSGPWNTFYEINSTNHTVSGTCSTVVATFDPGPGDTYVRFVAEDLSNGDGDYYIYYDAVNVTQGAAPSCFAPSNILISNVTNNSAILDWTASTNTPSDGYVYEVRTDTNPGVAGASLISTGTTLPNELTANATNLAATTSYYVYVRANCGAGDFSLWSQVQSFTTLCDPQNVPYLMPIDATTGSQLPECVTIQNLNNDAKFWQTGSEVNGITGRVMKYPYSANQAANDWFYTKGLYLTVGQPYRLKF